jgi:hypothetical protein
MEYKGYPAHRTHGLFDDRSAGLPLNVVWHGNDL